MAYRMDDSAEWEGAGAKDSTSYVQRGGKASASVLFAA